MATPKAPNAPAGLKRSGKALWRQVQAEYELEEHETRLLIEMCRTADLLDDLAAVVSAEGLMTAEGKVHPAAVEARQQKIALARLSAALRLPAGDENDHQKGARRPQRRVGARGVYHLRVS
jgi:hypothetical protein